MKSHSRSTQDVAKSVLTPTEPAVSTLCANTSGNLLLARANTSPECCWHRVCQHCANVRTGPLNPTSWGSGSAVHRTRRHTAAGSIHRMATTARPPVRGMAPRWCLRRPSARSSHWSRSPAVAASGVRARPAHAVMATARSTVLHVRTA